MNQFDQQWRRLTEIARQAGDSRNIAAPYGFATRVVARAGALPSAPWAPFERFAIRGLLVAAACGLAAVAYNFTPFATSSQTDALVAADTVGELLELS